MNNQGQEQELRFSFNVTNAVTATRIALSPVIAWLLCQGKFQVAGIVILIAASTDILDGFLARRLGQTSLGGAIFDLIADQLLIIPNLIIAIPLGLYTRTDNLMLWNPYPFVVVVIAAGVGVLAGVFIFIWKHRTLKLDFPAPPGISKAVFWFWLAPIAVGILQIGPDILLAMLMYFAIIYTLIASYFYFRKARYVFSN